VAHLTCINNTKAEILAFMNLLKSHHVDNILALLGDPLPGVPVKNDFKYASDLVSFIKANGDFNVLAACYPEGHIGAPSLEADIRNLKIKVDSGADQLVSQLFFDNHLFYSFLDRVEKVGIQIPIEAGIMPVVNKSQIERMIALSKASMPAKLTALLARYGDNNEDMLEAGIDYAIEQILDLIAHGVDGIHLYTMNNAYVARRISEAVRPLVSVRR